MDIRIFLILLVVVSQGVIAQDYSLTELNRTMNNLMQPIIGQQQQRQAYELQCVNGDDSSCLTIGVDPSDPCRSYIANYQDRDICRIQQCAAGNQDECRKSQAQNQRMNSYVEGENTRLDNRSRYNARSCESHCNNMKNSCGRNCDDSLCRRTCEVEYEGCKAGC